MVAARFFGLAFFRGLGSPTPSFWIALAAFWVVLASLCWVAFRAESLREAPPARRFVVLFAGVLLAVYFISPAAVGEAWPFHARIHFGALALLLPCLPARLSSRARYVLMGLVSALLAWQVVTFSSREMRFGEDYNAMLRRAEAIPAGATISSSLLYGNARWEGSFIHVLATLPEDIAYRRHAIMLNSFFPDRPYYWVRPRSGSTPNPDFHFDLKRDTEGVSALVQPVP